MSVLIFLQATRLSSSLKLPWYLDPVEWILLVNLSSVDVTRRLITLLCIRYTRMKGSGYFREHIKMPFGGSLDVVFVDTGSLKQVGSVCICEFDRNVLLGFSSDFVVSLCMIN